MDLLQSIVKLVDEGKPMTTEMLEKGRRLLDGHQAKLDFLKVGMVHQQMSRLPDVIQMIADVETSLFGPEGVSLETLTGAEKISLLKAMSGDLRESIKFLDGQSSRPTISSSETMSAVPQQGRNTEVSTHSLPAPARDNVRLIMERLLARSKTIEAEVVEGEGPQASE